MIPKYLKIKDFMSYGESEIDFSKIPNAIIIIGMEDGSLKQSNAVGKTTLFNAIYFALFDATVGKKSRVIRNGMKKCEVEFIFDMSNGTYKIYRTRTKTTKIVQVYKLNKNKWQNLSARTNAQTEKTICKILGITKKVFEKSSYFKQNDKFDIASATPEKRKAIIMDMLHLKEWSLYEKEAKNVKSNLEKEIEVLNNTLSMIGNPKEKITEYKNKLIELKKNIETKQNEASKIKNAIKIDIEKLNNIKAKNNTGIKDLENKLNDEQNYLSSTIKSIKELESIIDDTNKKINIWETEKEKEEKSLISYKDKYNNLLKNPPEEISDSLYDNLVSDIMENNNIILSKKSSFKMFSKKIPEEEFCPTCLTELNEDNKKDIEIKKEDKLNKLASEIKEYELKSKKLLSKKVEYDEKIKLFKTHARNITFYQNGIYTAKVMFNASIEKLNHLKSSLDQANNDIKTKKDIADKTRKTILSLEDNIKSIEHVNFEKDIEELNKKLILNKSTVNAIEKELLKDIYNKGSFEKEIETNENLLKKLKNINKELLEKKKDLSIYKAATNAFSTYGIPAMIVSTVLDSLQTETNSVLKVLRPSIQIQFFLEKERSDGKQEDTLGMKFFINGVEWDYEEISGGQQACISLALKLAISVINRKRCGADIRLLLLDECEQALDVKGIETFYEVVKNWSKDMTILIITHNEQLKTMFDSFILVSKEDGIAKAKVIK